jgi:hypothetical protein
MAPLIDVLDYNKYVTGKIGSCRESNYGRLDRSQPHSWLTEIIIINNIINNIKIKKIVN